MKTRLEMRSWIAVAMALSLAGCGEYGEDEEGGSLRNVPTSVCVSGKQWQSGNAESSLMHPGMDCIACHASGEGPSLGAAGTVYGALNEPDDCGGVPSVEVELTDANAQVFRMTSNAAGNFQLSVSAANAMVLPFTAKVIAGGVERMMLAPQSNANCASCHTAAGLNGAPGRILAP